MTDRPSRLDETDVELALATMRDLADQVPVRDGLDDIRRRTTCC
ncbi:hypothetical protein ACFYY8_33755 [Streptosporangium sp. NPDC001559]